jgi:hypothetical protein
MATTWTKVYPDVVYFMQILWSADVLETTEENIEDLVSYLNNPKQYEGEHQLWAEMDLPDPGDTNWDEFVSKVTSPDIDSYAEEEEEEDDEEE